MQHVSTTAVGTPEATTHHFELDTGASDAPASRQPLSRRPTAPRAYTDVRSMDDAEALDYALALSLREAEEEQVKVEAQVAKDREQADRELAARLAAADQTQGGDQERENSDRELATRLAALDETRGSRQVPPGLPPSYGDYI